MRLRLLSLVLALCACRREEPAPVLVAPSTTTLVSASPPMPSTPPSASIERPAALATPHRSLDDVAKAFVAAVVANDEEAMMALEPKPLEYAALLYPEFVKAGEPVIGSLGLQWAWDNLSNSSRKDRPKILARFGGKKLAYVRVRTQPPSPRGAVLLHPKVVVEATVEGKPVELTGIFAIVERAGRFCVLRYVVRD